MNQNQDNNHNKQEPIDKDMMADEDATKETKVCPMCGGNMVVEGDKMICDGCQHEMPV